MPGTRNRSTQPPSSARVRRAAHLERDRAVKARKRNPTAGERGRARIRAIKVVQQMGDAKVSLDYVRAVTRPQIVLVSGPFRATDEKVASYGWPVVGASGQLALYMPSRDKARAEARRLNAEGVPAIERELPVVIL